MSLNIDQRSSFIKIIIDSINQISIDKTAIVARKIKNDESIISKFPNGLRLEVGTPGIGSELKEIFQYKKNIGRKIELKYQLRKDIISNTYTLSDANDFGIVIEDNSKKHDVDYRRIISAKINVSFD